VQRGILWLQREILWLSINTRQYPCNDIYTYTYIYIYIYGYIHIHMYIDVWDTVAVVDILINMLENMSTTAIFTSDCVAVCCSASSRTISACVAVCCSVLQ